MRCYLHRGLDNDLRFASLATVELAFVRHVTKQSSRALRYEVLLRHEMRLGIEMHRVALLSLS